MDRPLPTAVEVRARREETGQGMQTCYKQLLGEWLDAEIAELAHENPRVASILMIMRKRDSL